MLSQETIKPLLLNSNSIKWGVKNVGKKQK